MRGAWRGSRIARRARPATAARPSNKGSCRDLPPLIRFADRRFGRDLAAGASLPAAECRAASDRPALVRQPAGRAQSRSEHGLPRRAARARLCRGPQPRHRGALCRRPPGPARGAGGRAGAAQPGADRRRRPGERPRGAAGDEHDADRRDRRGRSGRPGLGAEPGAPGRQPDRPHRHLPRARTEAARGAEGSASRPDPDRGAARDRRARSARPQPGAAPGRPRARPRAADARHQRPGRPRAGVRARHPAACARDVRARDQPRHRRTADASPNSRSAPGCRRSASSR